MDSLPVFEGCLENMYIFMNFQLSLRKFCKAVAFCAFSLQIYIWRPLFLNIAQIQNGVPQPTYGGSTISNRKNTAPCDDTRLVDIGLYAKKGCPSLKHLRILGEPDRDTKTFSDRGLSFFSI